MNPNLSAREIQVIRCAANGMTVEQTARQLRVTPDTIRRHRERIRMKVGGRGKGMTYSVAECFRRGELRPDATPSPIPLSPQCRRILLMMCTGMGNAEIGAQMHITLDSVKTHVRRMYKRMSANSRTHAVGIALRTGTVRFTPYPRTTNGISDA